MTRPTVRAEGCKSAAPQLGDPGEERQGRDPGSSPGQALLVHRARKPGLQCGARMPRLPLDYPERQASAPAPLTCPYPEC